MFKKIKKIFFRPKLIAKLTAGGHKVSVIMKNATADEVITLLFMAISQIAKSMGLEKRTLMNKIIDLDKIVIKAKNQERKEQYHLEQKAKHEARKHNKQ